MSRRAPWALYLATMVTWAAVGMAAAIGVSRQPHLLTEPVWSLRIALYVAWILTSLGATWGELGTDEPRRVLFLAMQSASAVAIVWTAPRSPALSLVFPVAAEAGFLMGPRRAVALVGVQTALLAAAFASIMGPVETAVTTACVLGGEIFGLGAGHLAVSERRGREELARLHAELQATEGLLAASVREAERVRISRDLHDTLGHHLTALSVNLEVASHLTSGKAAEHVGQAHTLARLLLADVREVVSALHEERAIDLGAALATMVAGVPQPKIHLAVPAELRIADPGLAHAVFRCVQEIVTNTVRHAGARNLWVELRRSPGGLTVEARDDGRGAAAYTAGQGLTGMGERLRDLGGSLVVASHPGRGFEVRATLPVPEGAG